MQQSGQQNLVGLLAAPNTSYRRRHHKGFMADQNACEQAKVEGFHSSQKLSATVTAESFCKGTRAAMLQRHTDGAAAHTKFMWSEPDAS